MCRCTCTVDNASALDGNGVSWVQCPVHFKVGTAAKYFSWSACVQFKFRYFQHQYRKKKNVNYSKNRVNVDKLFINEILLPPEQSAMLQKTCESVFTLFYMSSNSQKNSFPLYRKPIFMRVMHIFLVLYSYYQCYFFNVIHVRAIINNSHNKTNKCAEVQMIFLHTIHQNSDMFWSIVIICREVLTLIQYILKKYMITTDRNISDFVTYPTWKTQGKALI